jgi:hypothetical protein
MGMAGGEQVVRLAGMGNAVARPAVQQFPVRALTINEALEEVGDGRRKRDAAQHVIGMRPARRRGRRAAAVDPIGECRSDQRFLIRREGQDLARALHKLGRLPPDSA